VTAPDQTPPDQPLLWLTDAATLSDTALAGYEGWLGEGERRRCARFVRAQRRRQFIAGRALLRSMLARLLGMAPPDIRLLERPGAAPLLVLPGHEQVGLSISHSGRWVACAASTLGRVGVDIELIDPARDIDALAGQAFGAQQRAALAARPPESRVRDFYTLWSTAEARFKLAMEPASTFEFSHPELSVVLCCERLPTARPSLELMTLGS
jgi:4'-phosphopantetheinyl transferase